MARILSEGFEYGSKATSFWATKTYGDVGTTYIRSGSYAYRGGNENETDYFSFTGLTEGYLRFGYLSPQITSTNNPTVMVGRNSTTEMWRINQAGDGRLVVYTGSSTYAGITTTIMISGVWYSIEVHWKIDDSAGDLEVKIDGNLQVDYAGDTKPSTQTTVDNCYIRGGYGFSKWFDDFALNDTTGGTDNSWCGDGKIIYLQPDSAGDNTGLTPSTGSNYTCVDEVPPSTTTDYVYDTVLDDYDLYNLEASGVGSNAAIKRVYGVAAANDTVASGGKIQIGLKTESTEYWSSDISILTSNAWYKGTEYTSNPNTSSAWTTTQLDALQVGVKVRGDA